MQSVYSIAEADKANVVLILAIENNQSLELTKIHMFFVLFVFLHVPVNITISFPHIIILIIEIIMHFWKLEQWSWAWNLRENLSSLTVKTCHLASCLKSCISELKLSCYKLGNSTQNYRMGLNKNLVFVRWYRHSWNSGGIIWCC